MKNSANNINSLIAHDLKDPLASISGITEILIGNWSDFSEQEKLEILQEIRESSDSAMRLLTDLLDWSRRTAEITHPDKKEFNAERIIRTNIDLFKQQLKRRNVEVINHVLPDLVIYGDGHMFGAIIRNLLANAVKSCVNGGIIEISIDPSPSFCTFCIRDNGIGMTKSKIDQLFKTGETSSDKDSHGYSNGFGLILCRDFIRINGGKLWAESREGLGTKVFFTFPVSFGRNPQRFCQAFPSV